MSTGFKTPIAAPKLPENPRVMDYLNYQKARLQIMQTLHYENCLKNMAARHLPRGARR